MSANPFAPPQSQVADPVGDIARLNRIAAGQRVLIASVAVSIVSMFLRGPLGTLGIVVSLVSLVVAIVGGVRLTAALGGAVWVRVIVGILMAVPGINVIVMLILSGMSTRRLRASGYKVGFFGARQRPVTA